VARDTAIIVSQRLKYGQGWKIFEHTIKDTHNTRKLRGFLEIPDPAAASSSGIAITVTTMPTRAGGTAASSKIAIAIRYELFCAWQGASSKSCLVRLSARKIRIEMQKVTMRLTRTEDPAERTMIAGDGMIRPFPKSMFQGFTGSKEVLFAHEYLPVAIWYIRTAIEIPNEAGR